MIQSQFDHNADSQPSRKNKDAARVGAPVFAMSFAAAMRR
jgi:hypothetical protein